MSRHSFCSTNPCSNAYIIKTKKDFFQFRHKIHKDLYTYPNLTLSHLTQFNNVSFREAALNVSKPAERANVLGCDYWSVVAIGTQPSQAVARQAMLGPDWCTVVVLDKHSSQSYKIEGLTPEEESRVTFLNISAQKAFMYDKKILTV